MSGFRLAHERSKLKQLNDEELKTYLTMREELARSLVAAQSLTVPEDQNARRFFRVAQMYQLELDRTYKTLTKDISRAGFSAMLASEMKVGQRVAFSLSLKRDTDAITGEAKVVAVAKQGQWKI